MRPSRKSEMPARQKKNSASVSLNGTGDEQRPKKNRRQGKPPDRQLVRQIHLIKFRSIVLADKLRSRARATTRRNLRAKLVEHPRVGLHQPDQIFRLKHAERAEVRAGFGEAVQLVRAAERRVQQHRLRMPRMALDAPRASSGRR